MTVKTLKASVWLLAAIVALQLAACNRTGTSNVVVMREGDEELGPPPSDREGHRLALDAVDRDKSVAIPDGELTLGTWHRYHHLDPSWFGYPSLVPTNDWVAPILVDGRVAGAVSVGSSTSSWYYRTVHEKRVGEALSERESATLTGTGTCLFLVNEDTVSLIKSSMNVGTFPLDAPIEKIDDLRHRWCYPGAPLPFFVLLIYLLAFYGPLYGPLALVAGIPAVAWVVVIVRRRAARKRLASNPADDT